MNAGWTKWVGVALMVRAVLLVGRCAASPMHRPDRRTRSFGDLFVHGDRDSLCKLGPAKQAADALIERGLDAEKITFHGNHEIADVVRLEIARVLSP